MKILELNKGILCNSKWIVTSEQSKIIQEAAFDFGFSWYASGKKVLYTDSKFLILCKHYLTDINDLDCFNNQDSKYIERKFEDYFEEESIQEKLRNDSSFLNADDYNKYVGSFMWAVEQMKQGNKVRRKSLDYGGYIFLNSENFIVPEKSGYHSVPNHIENIEAKDWEIFEENKFGDFEVFNNGHIYFEYHNKKYSIIKPKHLNDLKVAIKLAEELQ